MRTKDKKGFQKAVEAQIKDERLVRQRHLQIAKGASKLFIKKGYYQTSIREISKATGLTIGNLYDYIQMKEDILFLVFDTFYSIWSNRLEEEGIFEIEDPIEQLETAIRKMLELVSEVSDMVLLGYTETKSLPRDYLKIILEKEKGVINCFEGILRKGLERGVFKVKDPVLAANAIVYLLAMEPLRGWNFRKDYSVEGINEFLIDLIKDFVVKNAKELGENRAVAVTS